MQMDAFDKALLFGLLMAAIFGFVERIVEIVHNY